VTDHVGGVPDIWSCALCPDRVVVEGRLGECKNGYNECYGE